MSFFFYLYIFIALCVYQEVSLFSEEYVSCRSGQKLVTASQSTDSSLPICQPCPLGTFNKKEYHNFTTCEVCSSNCPDYRMIIKKKCTPTNDIVCECRASYYLINESESCYPCKSCGPEEEVIANCTAWSNTVCKKCSEGYFKTNAAYSRCTKHRNCSEYNLPFESYGMPTSDAVCSKPIFENCQNFSSFLTFSQSHQLFWFISSNVMFVLFGCLIFGFFFMRRKHTKKINYLECHHLLRPHTTRNTSSNDFRFTPGNDLEVDSPGENDEKVRTENEFEKAVRKLKEIGDIEVENKILAKIKNDMQDKIEPNSFNKFGRILGLSDVDIYFAMQKEKEALPEMLQYWFEREGDFKVLNEKFFELSKRASCIYKKNFIKRVSEMINVQHLYIHTQE